MKRRIRWENKNFDDMGTSMMHKYRRVPIVATSLLSELAAFGGRNFRGVVTFGNRNRFQIELAWVFFPEI